MIDSEHKVKCPLCESDNREIINFLTFKELKDIWKSIPIEKYVNNKLIEISKCNSCKLHYFTPLIAGTNEFYSELAVDDYYQISWDYRKIYSLLQNYKIESILDYGCGNGSFLRLLPGNLKKVGYDYNAPNINKNNLVISKLDLNKLTSDTKFDMVISVQVLEHVSNIRKHLEKMKECLNDDGIMIVSVPNRDGIISHVEDEFNCLDFIPHHLSRWNNEVFSHISELLNLELIDIFYEPLSFQHYKWAKNSYLSKTFNNTLKGRVLRKIFITIQNLTIANSYNADKSQINGHSILGIFRKK